MTKLERITGKIFGETATSTGDDPQIGQFGSALAGTYVGTTDVATIQSLPAWSNGFIDAVTASNQYPPLPEMTGFGKVLSYQQNYILQQGIPEWDSGTTYYINNFCSKGDRLFISLTDSNTNNNPEADFINWKEFKPGSSSRNIGEIVHSLMPLTDAGLHLLDGALIQGTGIYAGFVNYMAYLYGDGSDVPSYFTTENDWQTSVTTYGVCGKFVYDSVNNTVRLPKVTGFMEGTIDSNALGDLVEAGLPNIIGHYNGGSLIRNGGGTSGAITMYNAAAATASASAGPWTHADWDINASLYNSIYGNSNTVQPQAIKGFMYIVIANTSKTEIEVDIDEIATDLNGKADVDLTNANQSGKNNIMSWCAPDYTNIESKNVNTEYIASSDGYLVCRVDGTTAGSMILVNDVMIATSGTYTSWNNVVNAPVAKGDTYKFMQAGGTYVYGYFVPMKGVN